ncbi:hypothetical protein P4118_01570 [Pseudomonas aeruginosa]|nr:hypothetical protein [Pseudomonas aeruginosa]
MDRNILACVLLGALVWPLACTGRRSLICLETLVVQILGVLLIVSIMIGENTVVVLSLVLTKALLCS